MTRKEQLKADLLKNFSDFQKIDPNVAPGGSDAANSIVAEGLADSIDRAIDDGVEFRFQGVFAVKDINAIQEKAPGYLYTCSDSGILKAKTELPVVKNTVVLWNGEDFKTFLVIPEATGSSVQISVDSFLSTLSGNPVQNKVVTTAINALSADLASEAASRADADTALGGRIDAEATARESADTTLQGNIDAEANARESADDALDARIDGEETAREQADGELQAQIDAISSRSDVVNIVASYVELVAYDTSMLADNDVIKVLADETHEDAIAYYRWSTTTEAWSFIGSQGPYYTISETDTLLAGKQNVNGSNATSAGMSTALNKLGAASGNFLDTDYIIGSDHTSASTTSSTTFVRRTFLMLYNRIKEKLDSVYAALSHTHTKSQITDFPDIPTFGNSWVVHKYINTSTYALRISIPFSVRTAGTSFLVMTSCNNGHKSLFCINFWKDANAVITNISVKHIYGNTADSVANKVYYEQGAGGSAGRVYISSNSSNDFHTSFAILCNSMEMTRNTSSISFDTVSRSVATSATEVATQSSVEPFVANYYDTLNANNSTPAQIYDAIRLNRPIVVYDNYRMANKYEYVIVDPSSSSSEVKLITIYPNASDSTQTYQRFTVYKVTLDNGQGKWQNYNIDLLNTKWKDDNNSYFSGTSRLAGSANSASIADKITDAGNTAKNINVRWSGSSVGSNFRYFACFRSKDSGDDNTSATICDIPIDEARKQILGSSKGNANTPLYLDGNGSLQTCGMSQYLKNNVENVVTTSGKIGLTCEDGTDAIIKAMDSNDSIRYIQLDVEAIGSGSNVSVYGKNGQTNGSYIVSIDKSTVNSGSRGVCRLGNSTDTVVGLGKYNLNFSGTVGTDPDTIYFL